MYLVPSVRRDAATMMLYLGYPALSAGVAGFAVGHRVVGARSPLGAALAGIVVVALAFAIFAPLYVITYGAVSDRVQQPIALLASVLTIGVVMTAPVLVPLGAVAGWALFVIWRRASGSKT